MQTERDWAAIVERIDTEGAITATEAAKLTPNGHSRRGYCSTNAIVGWILRGKRGVFLDGYRGMGKTWWTSLMAIRRFKAELSKVEFGRRARTHAAIDEILKKGKGPTAAEKQAMEKQLRELEEERKSLRIARRAELREREKRERAKS